MNADREPHPDDLETALRTLGTRLAVPEPQDMTAAVLSRLDAPRRRTPRLTTRLVAAAITALVALATAMALSPAVRAAVYDLLRIGGVEIHENQPAPVSPSPVPLLPGERDVTLAEARAAADFPLTVPDKLGEPTAVRLVDDGQVVSMAFDTPDGEVRVDEFGGRLAPVFAKFTTGDDVHQVTVDGAPGIWVDRPHVVLYLDRAGTIREESARLAGSTLIWERNGTTYRVEGALAEDQALTIAASLH